MAHLSRTFVHRSLVASVLGLLLALSACGLDVQTMQPYTPSEGVNANVGATGKWVRVRNLMILSREDGVGYVSASLLAQEQDTLTAVAGHPFKADDSAGAAFQTVMPGPVTLRPGSLVVLTQGELIEVRSADLILGADAELTLTFSNAGELTIRVPVVDANQPDYATVTPSPTPGS